MGNEKDSNRGCAYAIFAVLIVGGIVALVVTSGGDGGRGARADAEREAQFACHDHVDVRLKAPGTSNYEDLGEAGITGTDPYTVNGWVDAENSFGGEVRTYYVCVVNGDGSLVSLDIVE